MRILIFILLLFTSYASANDYVINIDQAKTKKVVVAFVPLKYTQPSREGLTVGQNIYRMVFNNLNSTFYFKFLGAKAYVEDIKTSSIKPNTMVANGFEFKNWKVIGTDILIKSSYSVSENIVTFEAYAYNVSNEKAVIGRIYRSKVSNISRLANRFSNDLMLALTGRKGNFGSKVVVSRSIPRSVAKEIFVMDWDGRNVKQISRNRTASFAPSWSPDGKYVAYTSFIFHKKQRVRNADLLLYSFDTGRTKILSARKGSNSGSVFSKDGKQIFFTISSFGRSDIYSINSLMGSKLSRVTNGPRGAMNIEVDISPDGKKIAFSSDRSGRPMIYVSGINGQNLKRLTYAGKYNSTPIWSPDGKKITFASNIGGYYDIFLIDANGNNLKRLTQSSRLSKRSNNEEPTFSPDGRSIMFVGNRTGKRQLYITDLNGTNIIRVTNDDYNYYKPKWGWHKNDSSL